MHTNRSRPTTPAPRTHEGAIADRTTPIMELRRAVMACLLFEDSFYESGVSIADRIKQLTAKISPEAVCEIAIEAREVGHLRHVPLMLLASLLKKGNTSTAIKPAITRVIKRADELAEIIAIFAKVWGYNVKDIKKKLPAQLKEGVADAFNKFDEYSLAKYDRSDAVIKLRDVAFMVHWKPENREKEILAAKLLNKTYVAPTTKGGMTVRGRLKLKQNEVGLETPDTWETALSAGGAKGEEFTRLLQEKKLGYLALLRNLRNMEQAGVDRDLVIEAIKARQGGADKVFPFRFIAAARAAKSFEPALDQALQAQVAGMEQMKGTTIILVDISGSMDYALSSKSDLKRTDAAAALASIFPGEDVRIFSFSNRTVEVPRRIGMGGVEAILSSQPHGGTDLGGAVAYANGLKHDRLIVITDEQSSTRVPTPKASEAYMINVASYQNGVGYKDGWKHIDGFSENVIRWIAESERMDRGEPMVAPKIEPGPKRKRNIASDIKQGLKEAIAFSKGKGKGHITVVGKNGARVTKKNGTVKDIPTLKAEVAKLETRAEKRPRIAVKVKAKVEAKAKKRAASKKPNAKTREAMSESRKLMTKKAKRVAPKKATKKKLYGRRLRATPIKGKRK